MSQLSHRKGDHLDLCASDKVAFRNKSTLLEQVQLLHCALPELSIEDLDLTTSLVGRTISAPIVIAAMTGGVDRAEEVNRDLASVAEETGLAFGFGSMRPLLQNKNKKGYFVRDVAPNALLFGNIGIVQAYESSTQQLVDMVGETDVNALCVHLNPAMEVIQTHGDRDFRGGIETLTRLADALPVPVIAKETGCGLSRSIGEKIIQAGVRCVDTSGAGGTSWVGVETLRAKAKSQRLGDLYWDWGIPTGASVAQLNGLGLEVIATGGIHTGLDIAKSIALGATAGGIARPVLMAWNDGGRQGALDFIRQIEDEVRFACLLTGSSMPRDLQQQKLVVREELRNWIPDESPLWQRICGARR